MATIYSVNKNINRFSKRLDYSIANVWNRSAGSYFDNGEYRIFLKESPKVRLYPDEGGYQVIYETTDVKYQACLVDVTVVINSDNAKVFKIGDYKVNTNAISNTRPDRTNSYFIDILSPFIPNYNDL
jgi:hypothetical protein